MSHRAPRNTDACVHKKPKSSCLTVLREPGSRVLKRGFASPTTQSDKIAACATGSSGKECGFMRVLISADAEGVTGITNTNELLFGRPHYEFMRTMMTDDVNAAVDGAFAGGAPEVVVNDAHWTMTNVQIERLDPRATLIKGFQKPLCMVAGVEDADAVFFLGYHARTGDSDGVV